MPSTKSLTVQVKLDTSKAEKALTKFQKKIQNVNKAVNSAATSQNKVTRSIEKSATAMNRVSAAAERSTRSANKLKTAVNGTKNAADRMNNSFRKSSSSIDNMVRNIRRAYVLIMGVVAASQAIGVVDQVTAAENRLNYVNGYDANATEADMKKMFNSAMKTRTGYMDMVSNVSKSMALAGGAFGGNMDTAIRFQEVMAEAYSIGGASVAEQASSMYQMIQALGAGVLAGDELRSVREGAPLAYQAIEKFAQGVYNTTDSLKEMASEGMITSDIVVAAILNAGQEMDTAFEHTALTFGQAFQMIRNVAVESFRPVMESLTEWLNSASGQNALNMIYFLIRSIASAATMLFNFLKENSWLVVTVLEVIYVLLAYKIAGAIYRLITAAMDFMALNPYFAVFLAIFTLMMIVINATSDSFADACGKMTGAAAAAMTVIYDVFANAANACYLVFANAFALIERAFGLRMSAMLSKLTIFAKGADMVFGTDYSSKLSNTRNTLEHLGTFKTEGILPYKNPIDSYHKYHDLVEDKITGYKNSKSSSLYQGYNLENLMNPASVGQAANAGNVGDDVKKIKDSTSKMADSMQVSEEYLKLLRQIAEDSWKRGVTSVNIEVAMNNKATVKSESDLDGLVTKLTKKLEEELSATAAGVYG